MNYRMISSRIDPIDWASP